MDYLEPPDPLDEKYSSGDDNYSDEEDNAYFDPTSACNDAMSDDEDEKDNAKQLKHQDILSKFGMTLEPAEVIHPVDACESRLLKELKIIYLSESVNCPTSQFHLSIVNNNLKQWHLKIKEFPDFYLNIDLATLCPKNPYVMLELTFPSDYPFAPPFVRILSPAIKSGHVILGGALLLDVLIPNKCSHLPSPLMYTPAMQLLVLFSQLVVSMVDGKARVDTSPQALDAYTFERAKFMHDSIIGLVNLDWKAVFEDFSVYNNHSYPRLSRSNPLSPS